MSVQVDFLEQRVQQSTLLELPVAGTIVSKLNPLLPLELEAKTEQPIEAATPVIQLLDFPIREVVM